MPTAREPWFNENRQQLLSDLLRNSRPSALVENAATLGSGLVAQAGTGLGTLAGMARSKLKGEPIDQEAAVEGIGENVERFTYQPRTEGGRELQRGLGAVMEPIDRGMKAVGQGAANVTGSPAVGAGVYTALNVLDPELLAPGAAKIAVLRGASNIARRGAETAVPMSEALRNVPKGQRGAYSLEDLSAVEGEYEFQSPTLGAFDKLKKQEQKVPGKQLMKALVREGAKPDEMKWMGLDELLNTDEVLDAGEVANIAKMNQPKFEHVTQRGGTPDESEISEKARELAWDDSDLEYPEQHVVYRGSGRHREELGRYDSPREAREAIKDMKDSDIEAETEHYLENIGEYFDEDQLAEMSDADKQQWAEEAAQSSVEDNSDYNIESEVDTDSEPSNLDDLTEYYENQIRENPSEYGLEGGKPDYGEYTVGERGSDEEGNYTVNALKLKREERYGKNSMGTYEAPGISKELKAEMARRLRRDARPGAAEHRRNADYSHYKDLGKNQIFFTRETDRPAPAWGSVRKGIGNTTENELMGPEDTNVLGTGVQSVNPMRTVEEAQSDWYQKGRKAGWDVPGAQEERAAKSSELDARSELMRKQALGEIDTALENPHIKRVIEDAQHQVALGDDADNFSSAENLLQKLETYRQVVANPESDFGERLSAANNVMGGVYRHAPSGSEGETLSSQLRNALGNLPGSHAPDVPLVPEGPLSETKQYMQMAAADALRRAVMEGQQYIAFTPGQVHTKRWGTDSVQWAVDPNDPMEVRLGSKDLTREGEATDDPLAAQQAGAEKLLNADEYMAQNGGTRPKTLRLDDPSFDKQLRDYVEQRLSYGVHEHAFPSEVFAKRTAQLKKAILAAAEKGGGTAGHMSPRAEGFAKAYPPIEEYYSKLLRKLGSTRKIEDVIPGELRGFEIDPEVAQAVKRGLPIPY